MNIRSDNFMGLWSDGEYVDKVSIEDISYLNDICVFIFRFRFNTDNQMIINQVLWKMEMMTEPERTLEGLMHHASEMMNFLYEKRIWYRLEYNAGYYIKLRGVPLWKRIKLAVQSYIHLYLPMKFKVAGLWKE